jgi:outer membrane protein assembly factor BamA
LRYYLPIPSFAGGSVHRVQKATVFILTVALFSPAQSTKRNSTRTDDKIVAQEVVISGTSTLSSEQLHDIRSSLTSVTMRDDDEEVEERMRYEFQQRGYFDADVTNLKVVPLDPLAKKKAVRIEAEVNEGPQFHLAKLKFNGNQAYTSDELRKMFSIHAGDVFDAEKIRLGLQTMREQYTAKGFFEIAPVPNTEKSGSARMTVTFDIDEGIQYRMGELKIEGPSDLAQKLAANWELKPGEPFDYAYLEKFLAKNRESFPEGFNDDRDVLWLRDCSDNTVIVTIELDPKRPWKPKPQDKPCETPKTESKTSDKSSV